MKSKPIKIDWDELEEAFSSRAADSNSSLDSISGHVVLEGEGEEDDLDGDDGSNRPIHAAAVGPAVRREDPTRLRIRPPDLARRIAWMKAFVGENSGGHSMELIAELKHAASEENPAPALLAVLNRDPELRDAWYLFRSDRLHEMIDAWVAENDLKTTDPPPWSR